ncbi:MAG: fibronectin type III domain-containing protein, partial [Candidatus Zixiibacteriota bacterium]
MKDDLFKAMNLQKISIFIFLFFALLSLPVAAQESELAAEDTLSHEVFLPAPPTNVIAKDFDYDRGDNAEVSWTISPDDDASGRILGYDIYRAAAGSNEFTLVGAVLPGDSSFKDKSVENGIAYVYKIGLNYEGGQIFSAQSDPVVPDTEFINFKLLNLFIIGLLIAGSVTFFIAHAKRGRKLFIRKIAGLEAIDEAIGRATEMGRPILFIPGINDMDDVQTIAGITILGRVARVVADYDIKINMPVSRSIVMTTARETIKEAYMGAGRPDAYNDDMVRYITDEQFGYVAAVDGIMVREKPATCFYLGAFFAESLILAETGNSIGAIQIAGTAMPAQLPFFVAACDYTLIGEELFAASAYLSNEPKQLGSLKGQDVGKFLAMVAILIGVLSATIASAWGVKIFVDLYEFMTKIF